eukprot:698311-Hanusia_phi.AAC.1
MQSSRPARGLYKMRESGGRMRCLLSVCKRTRREKAKGKCERRRRRRGGGEERRGGEARRRRRRGGGGGGEARGALLPLTFEQPSQSRCGCRTGGASPRCT